MTDDREVQGYLEGGDIWGRELRAEGGCRYRQKSMPANGPWATHIRRLEAIASGMTTSGRHHFAQLWEENIDIHRADRNKNVVRML